MVRLKKYNANCQQFLGVYDCRAMFIKPIELFITSFIVNFNVANIQYIIINLSIIWLCEKTYFVIENI